MLGNSQCAITAVVLILTGFTQLSLAFGNNADEWVFVPPDFLTLPENQELGSILQVSCSVPAVDNIRIVFSGRTKSNPFTLVPDPTDRSKATLNLTSYLDFETDTLYTVRFQAFDKDQSIISKSDYNMINVEDINDNPPEFEDIPTSVQIEENSEVPIQIFNFAVSDKDTTPKMTIYFANFSLTEEGPSTGYFQLGTITYPIDPQTGVIKAVVPIELVQSLDYEKTPSVMLKILVQDGPDNESGKCNSVARYVTVNVIDQDDEDPVFTSVPPSNLVERDENEVVGTKLFQVVARDGDLQVNNSISYSLTAAPYFSVDSNSGIVTNLVELDREVKESYTIDIMAIENSMLHHNSTVTISLKLRDINDNAPYFQFPNYSANISEDAMPNFPLILKETYINVTDADLPQNANFRVSFLDHGDLFGLSPETGGKEAMLLAKLMKGGVLDYEDEAMRQLNLTMIAVDQGNTSLTSTSVISLTVLDANDNYPQFEQTKYNFSIPENSPENTVIGTVKATDLDSGYFGTDGIRYTRIVGQADKSFLLNWTSGDVLVGPDAVLDRERMDSYSLTVEARDDLGKGNANMAFLTVTLTDINDNVPIIESSECHVVSEDQEGNFCTIYARDGDEPNTDNSRLGFTIENSMTNAGEVIPLRVRVCDHGFPQLCNLSWINVTLYDVINPPKVAFEKNKTDL